MTIQEFLLWLMSGLGASFVFSYLAERWAWFQELASDTKKLYSTAGSAVIAILSYVVYTYVPAEVWVMLSPYWQLVVAVVTVNYGTQVFHSYDRKLPSANN